MMIKIKAILVVLTISFGFQNIAFSEDESVSKGVAFMYHESASSENVSRVLTVTKKGITVFINSKFSIGIFYPVDSERTYLLSLKSKKAVPFKGRNAKLVDIKSSSVKEIGLEQLKNCDLYSHKVGDKKSDVCFANVSEFVNEFVTFDTWDRFLEGTVKYYPKSIKENKSYQLISDDPVSKLVLSYDPMDLSGELEKYQYDLADLNIASKDVVSFKEAMDLIK